VSELERVTDRRQHVHCDRLDVRQCLDVRIRERRIGSRSVAGRAEERQMAVSVDDEKVELETLQV
jgi:hypothetical protein